MKTRFVLWTAAFLFAVSVGGSARADHGAGGYYGYGLWPPYGFGFSGTLYGLGHIPVPPYHALHPPVYYGQRIRRPYGDSPYAWPPQRPTPPAAPRMVVNPYVPQDETETDAADSERTAAASQPQMIVNPYYAPNAELASVSDAVVTVEGE